MKIVIPLRRNLQATTLAEVVMSLAITGFSIGAIIQGYVGVTKMIDLSTYETAAQCCVANVFEHTLAAQWKPQNGTDELIGANFPATTVSLGGQNVMATNVVTITSYPNTAPLKVVQVECTWSLHGKVFTNTLKAFRAPNS